MSKRQVFAVFTLFACATPVGIIVGDELHELMGMHAMLIIKAIILSLAAGTFLYMGIWVYWYPLNDYCYKHTKAQGKAP